MSIHRYVTGAAAALVVAAVCGRLSVALRGAAMRRRASGVRAAAGAKRRHRIPRPPAAPRRRSRDRASSFLGDSLTAGLGLATGEAYPALLQQRLDDGGLDYQVVNAGVSGDTSAGGLARLDWALEGDVRISSSRSAATTRCAGCPAEAAEAGIWRTIIERAQARGITVVLAGMEAPPNFGRDYIVAFHKVYPDARAAEYHVALVPFLLQGVAGSDTLNQRDGIHPTAEGARIVADNVWTVAEAARRSAEKRPDHDRAARGLENGHERQRAADDSSSALAADSARPVRRDRRAVGQRQVDAARADRRPRRADRRFGADRRRRHHARSAKMRWRGCAARRSASCSSSFT